MKDQIQLLAAGLAFALAAWAFWHFLGDDAAGTLSILAIVLLAADNVRLRSQLRESNKPDKSV
jgi:hypothetical protein